MYDLKALTSVCEKWPRNRWRYELQKIVKGNAISVGLDEGARKFVLKQVNECCASRKFKQARDWIFLALVLGGESAVSESNMLERLLASKYEPENAQKIHYLLCELRDDIHALYKETSEYCESLSMYALLWHSASEDDLKIRQKLRGARSFMFSILLRIAESAFNGDLACLDPGERSSNPKSLEDLSREEIASAVSYLIGRFGSTLRSYHVVAIESHEWLENASELVFVSHRMVKLRAVGNEIVRHGYRIERISAECFAVSPPSERYGQALSYGSIRLMSLPSTLTNTFATSPRSDVVLEKFYLQFGAQLVQVETMPTRRIVLKFPEPIWKLMGSEFFLKDQYFAEEAAMLADASYELLAAGDDLMGFQLASGLKLIDYFKFCRVIRFLAGLKALKLKELGVDKLEYWNSLLLALPEKEFFEILSMIGFTDFQIREIIKCAGWTPGSNANFDIQYSPLIHVDKKIILMPQILSKSNVIRNVLSKTKKRIFDNGVVDPLSDILKSTLSARFPKTFPKLKYKFGKFEGDVDVLSFDGKTLYAFECKNMLLPCTVFERQTLTDHLDTAAVQLDRFTSLFRRPEMQLAIRQQTGWDIRGDVTIQTGIILSHRLLSGIQYKGHPVRHIWELVNLLRTGKVRIRNFEYSIWQNSQFSSEDLNLYLADNSEPYAPAWKSFYKNSSEMIYSGKTLRTYDYGLAIAEYLANAGAPAEHLREFELASRGEQDG